jgi:two-component system CheB/CheR fusion protein
LATLVPSAENIALLQGALLRATEELQSLAEEHQTALEELRSSNEELHSVNEEMQSTNEELETSKEELQSLNEELHTVNARLTEKLDELAEANSDLRNLFDSTEIATIFLDRHLIIRSFTHAIASLYNLIPSDQGRPLTDIVSRLNYHGLREDVAFVLSTLEPLERRVTRTDRSAQYIMRILPYREPDSTVSGVLVTFVDVTSIVQAEAALVEADVRKDIFLATLSHELRNPLAPIRTAVQVLQSSNLPHDEMLHAQSIIARQVSHMGSLLDDLLDVSRITRGAFLLKKEYVDVQTLIEDAVEAVQPVMDAKRHTLRVEYPPFPVTIEVDPLRITQIVTNLLTNAAKYTPVGGLIWLGTRFEASALIIYVRDNGIGLTAEMIAKIFDMFTQIESDLGRKEGGLGIGLALAKGLAELHGGRIEASSAGLGQGSEFAISLPKSLIVEKPERSQTHATNGPAPTLSKRILVADDNQDGAETMSMLLKLSGHEVYVAHSGTEALEVAKRERPDIAVLDIGMPDLNGYEVAERIRHEAWGERIKLIAVTGWGQAEDKRRALGAGFNYHLTKPVDPSQLEALFTT